MRKLDVDITIIGGGPAGLAAALKAKELGVKNVLLLERNDDLGGILQQCIHDGFGLHRFKKQMSGPGYAQIFMDEIKNTDIEVKLNTMVLDITEDKVIHAMNKEDGVIQIHSKAIILAMGCRERTRNQVFIWGTRPSGVMTAGNLQRYLNIDGLIPGKKAVILGSGDIGLIMARRMTWEDIEVEGVYEIMENPGGLTRNVVQCLDDFQIPLHLSTSVIEIHGNRKLEGVTVAKMDEHMNVIAGTERYIDCDLLVLSVGLIPENELSKKANVELSNHTKGPIISDNMMTNIPGIFACGNVVAVFDLVDYVSETGELAAKGAVDYLLGQEKDIVYNEVIAGENVSLVLPSKINIHEQDSTLSFYIRTKKTLENCLVKVLLNDQLIYKEKHRIVKPAEMIVTSFNRNQFKDYNTKEKIVVQIEKEEK